MDQAIVWILTYLGLLNAVTFVLSFLDKVCAVREWRRPFGGGLLLVLSAVGGSVGAKLGQGVFLHKVLDYQFTTTLNLICIFQIVILSSAWLFLSVDVSFMQDLRNSGGGDSESAMPQRFGPGADGKKRPFG